MKINKLKKLLSIMFLMPILPMFGIETETNTKDEADDVTDDNKTDDNNTDTDNKKSEETKVENKVYSQKDLDNIIAKITKKGKSNTEKEIRLAIEKMNMSEAEKTKLEREELQKAADSKVENANKKLIKFEVKQMSEKLGFLDADVAMLLIDNENIEIDDDGNITGVEEELKRIMQSKPHLVKKANLEESKTNVGDDQSSKTKKSPFNMTDLIRRATGR